MVRRIHLAGGSLRDIAEALDLSHQRVQQMVGSAGGSWWRRVWRTRNAKRGLACSFCRRSQDQTAKLIAGPGVFICDACVALAERGLAGSRGGARGPWTTPREEMKGRCLFCRKPRSAERRLLTSAAGHVCAECVDACRQILEDAEENA
jgi:hypothetical protein